MAEQPSIPILDLSAFGTEGHTESRSKSARALYKACHDVGFVQIIGHGIKQELLQEAFDWSKNLFSLSHDEKMKAPQPDCPVPHRGSSYIQCCHPPRAKVMRLFSSGARKGLL